MPKAHRTIRVTRVAGHPFCYHVESWSTPGTAHLVKIIANRGVGECTCERWRFTCWPNMKANGFKAVPYKTRGPNGQDLDTLCRHVEVARFFEMNAICAHLWAEHGGPLYDET